MKIKHIDRIEYAWLIPEIGEYVEFLKREIARVLAVPECDRRLSREELAERIREQWESTAYLRAEVESLTIRWLQTRIVAKVEEI